MADIKNTDITVDNNSAEDLKDKTESLRKEIYEYVNFQKFIFKEFKRSDTFKKYSSLGTFIPESNKSIGADVARLMLGRFKEKKPLVALKDEKTGEFIRDENGKVKKVDQSDNSFRAQLKRSGLTSFGRYISDDKQGFVYDILRTVAGRFSDDFAKKQKALSKYEKEISENSAQEVQSDVGAVGDTSEILSTISENSAKILENTEGIALALNGSSAKIVESTKEIAELTQKNVDVSVKSLDSQTKAKATDLEKEIEEKRSLDELKDALKGIEKNTKNTVDLVAKSSGGADGGGSVIDDIADVATTAILGKGIFGKIFGKVKGFGTSTVGMLKHGAQVGTNKALPLLHSVKDKVADVGTSVLDKGKALFGKGRDLANSNIGPVKSMVKKLGFVGAGITAISSIFDINKASDEIDEKVKSGVISKEDANKAKVNKAIEIGSSGVGGAVGGLVGTAKGAALGATLGSVVPVIGTGIGAILGGLVGGFGGGWLGEKLGGLVGDAVTDDVKENKSFVERKEELNRERENVKRLEEETADKLYYEKLDTLAEAGVIEKVTDKDGSVSYKGKNYGASKMEEARYDAEVDAFYRVSDKYQDIAEKKSALAKERRLAIESIDGKNISPSNKNQEHLNMANESDRANFEQKQREAKKDSASEKTINNNVHTEVKNQTINNNPLKPRSDWSISERLYGRR